MKIIYKYLFVVLLIIGWTSILRAQVENTYVWGAFDHSCWKVAPNSSGYVMIGNRFFEPNNTVMYAQGFDENGKSLWLRAHPAPGFTSLSTFWKSFTETADYRDQVKFFAVVAGQQNGPKAYAILLNSYGHKIWDRVSVLPNGIEFGGVTNATKGGWIATGSDGSGNLIAVRFDSYGKLQWLKTLPISGFGWSIIASEGGGYLIGSTGSRMTRIDDNGNLVWSTAVPLPVSPDGSNYTYTEFEELVCLPYYDGGVVITGSAFSNSHSAVYTAAVDYNGKVLWKTVHDPQNTALPGTPVSWISNAIIDGYYVITSWRRGPVSSGGTMYYQRQKFNGVLDYKVTSLKNTTPVQEAFMIRTHNKYVVGGTRGSYSAAYSYVNSQLPLPKRSRSAEDDLLTESVAPANNLPEGWVQISRNNTKPIYEYHPASRVFNSEMRVFPNPSNGIVNVGGRIEPGALLRVTDMMGRIVLERRIGIDERMLELNLTGKGNGIFNVEMIGAQQVVTEKIIIQ